ncbi:MAG: hypothetical protein Q4C55_03985 [Eubacterium sp.]|nr:hypothetical protein [Eubacterium sp.]
MKKMIVLWLLAAAVLLTGCGSWRGDSGEGMALDELTDGFYVKSGNLFYPLEAEGKTYDGDMVKLTNAGKSQMIWLWEGGSAIPEYKEGAALVLKQHQALPEQVFFQKMEDKGVTLGMILAQTATLDVYGLSGDDRRRLCPGSSAEEVLASAAESYQDLRISEIGGVKVSQEHLSDINTFEGLTPGEDYAVGIYEGSVYQEVYMRADTRVFKSVPEVRCIADQYRYTREGYAEVVLPEELEPGYYYIDDAGLLLVTKN